MTVRKRHRGEIPPSDRALQDPWKILVVDDEPDVHSVTTLVLRQLTFEGRGLELLHAFRGAEALEILRRETAIAVVLLDVVMETQRDGLDLCRAIREELQNPLVRIVIRTGQPGVAPEREVVETYDIDDYREKADLSNEKLYSCIRLALKGYRDLSRMHELYEETLSLQRATEKVVNHLSHELRTPLGIVRATLSALASEGDPGVRQRLRENGERSLLRLIELHDEIRDIFRGDLGRLGDLDPLVLFRDLVRRLVREVEADRDLGAAGPLDLSLDLPAWVEAARERFAHRGVEVVLRVEPGLRTHGEPRALERALVALLRNAIENTPDGGRIEVAAEREGEGGFRLAVQDRGVGITAENQRYLFSGFFHTQATDNYSSRRPFEFDAGGKGLDLLRLKVWAQRFGWRIELESQRCVHLPTERDLCPGRISLCPHCAGPGDCAASGGSRFAIVVP